MIMCSILDMKIPGKVGDVREIGDVSQCSKKQVWADKQDVRETACEVGELNARI